MFRLGTAHISTFLKINWNETQLNYTRKSPKRAYYLSLEFLMGRTLDNAVSFIRMFAFGTLTHPFQASQPGLEKPVQGWHQEAWIQYGGHPGAGTGCRSRKWWPGASCRLLSRFWCFAGVAPLGIWSPLQVWDLPATYFSRRRATRSKKIRSKSK